ncbi:MAG: DUF523 domain-containing protein [Sulfuricurvum sp.]
MTIAVSACLLGERCRYDGIVATDKRLEALGEKYRLIPFCPEAPGMGTPRPRIRIVDVQNTRRLVRESDGEDVTGIVVGYTLAFLEDHRDIRYAVLKSKSPSCGYGSAPIYDSEGMIVDTGDGLAAACFRERGVHVMDEIHFEIPKER